MHFRKTDNEISISTTTQPKNDQSELGIIHYCVEPVEKDSAATPLSENLSSISG